MKIVKEEPDFDVDLGTIHISPEDLVEVVEKSIPEENNVEITIGEKYSKDYILLENREEFRQNSAILSIPFTIDIEKIQIRFRSYGVNVSAPPEQKVAAKAVVNRLSQYRPWYRFAFRAWTSGILTMVFVLFTFSDLYSTLPLTITVPIVAIFLVLFLLSILVDRQNRPKIIQVVRTGFWQRNKDNIAMLVIGAFLSLFANQVVKFVADSQDKPVTPVINKESD